jgi:hypothetical protein
MKPHVMMMRLKVRNSKEDIIEEIGPFQAVNINDVLFVRMSKEEALSLKAIGTVDQMSAAAAEKGKSFIILPPGAEILEIEQKWEVKK